MLISLLLAASLSQKAPPAGPNEADLRCVAAFSLISASVPAAQRPGVVSGVMFFYGRIEGRKPGFDLEGGLRRVLKTAAGPEAFRPDLARCGAEMQKRSAYLTQMGKNLQTRPVRVAAPAK